MVVLIIIIEYEDDIDEGSIKKKLWHKKYIKGYTQFQDPMAYGIKNWYLFKNFRYPLEN